MMKKFKVVNTYIHKFYPISTKNPLTANDSQSTNQTTYQHLFITQIDHSCHFPRTDHLEQLDISGKIILK
jgi:hypothetical protein